MERDAGRCVACGFLAKFDLHYSGPPPYIYEMPPKDRSTGDMSTLHLAAKEIGATFPQCYVNAAELWQEITVAVGSGTGRQQAASDTFTMDRHCPKWHPYTQGYSPQEHLEEIRMQDLELKRQVFELKLFEMNHTLNEKAEKSNKRVTMVLIAFAILEVVFGAASVMQLAYPNGWPWLMKLLGNIPPEPFVPRFPPM